MFWSAEGGGNEYSECSLGGGVGDGMEEEGVKMVEGVKWVGCGRGEPS